MADRQISEAEREASAEAGHTGYGESFPMDDCDEVRRAIQSYGRAPEEHRAQLRRKIAQRNIELGCDIDLPADWHLEAT